MAVVNMTDLSYNEFKSFLAENNVKSNTIRIYLAGMGCGDPIFNLTVDERALEDVSASIGDITFIMDGIIVKEFGGVTINCYSEDGKTGFNIEPNIKSENSGCSSGCAECH